MTHHTGDAATSRQLLKLDLTSHVHSNTLVTSTTHKTVCSNHTNVSNKYTDMCSDHTNACSKHRYMRSNTRMSASDTDASVSNILFAPNNVITSRHDAGDAPKLQPPHDHRRALGMVLL